MKYPNIKLKERPRIGSSAYQSYQYDRFPHDDRDSHETIRNKNNDRSELYDRMEEEEYESGVVSYLDVEMQPIARKFVIKRSMRMTMSASHIFLYRRIDTCPICRDYHDRRRNTVLNGSLLRLLPIQRYDSVTFENSIWYLSRSRG